MTTHIIHGTIVHEARAIGSHGFATRCNVLIPATKPQYVRVETKAGVQVPTRGWPCGAGCFETKKEGAPQ
jgi:hypothetical protein